MKTPFINKKVYIIIIVFIMVISSCKAQQTVNLNEIIQPEYYIGTLPVYDLGTLPSNTVNRKYYYIKDINNRFNDVVGVWRWQDGDSYFEITLEKLEMESYPEDTTEYHDSIYGKYKYVNNGIIIAEVQEIYSMPLMKVVAFYESPSQYHIMIKDTVSETHKFGQFVLTSPTTATLNLKNSAGVKINYGNGQEFALPTDVILTKQ